MPGVVGVDSQEGEQLNVAAHHGRVLPGLLPWAVWPCTLRQSWVDCRHKTEYLKWSWLFISVVEYIISHNQWQHCVHKLTAGIAQICQTISEYDNIGPQSWCFNPRSPVFQVAILLLSHPYAAAQHVALSSLFSVSKSTSCLSKQFSF